jgi:uncharacterized protein YjdB
MRAYILAVTGHTRHRLGALSLIASALAVILSCSGLVSTGPNIDTVTVSLTIGAPIVGQKLSAVATLRDPTGLRIDGPSITWSLSNPAVASIASSGNTAEITTIAVGTTEVTATSGGHTGGAALDIAPSPSVPVASTEVDLAASSLNPGQTTQAAAITRDANNNVVTGRAISWGSSNAGVATVSASGLVTAVAAGTSQITATSEGQSGSAALTVASTPPVPVASVSVTLAASSRNPGQTTQATAITRDANNNVLSGRAVSWSSSNTGVATVSSSGLVTAIAIGTVQIIAACEGQSGNATLTATTPAPVASVSVALGTGSLNPGLTTQAIATTRDASNNVLTGRAIAWGSDNTAVATVSASGLVRAVAVGNAQITASSEGQSGSATLGIQDPPPPPPPGSSNEPAGMTLITERAFNALKEDPTWEDYNSPSIVRDSTAPKSPSNVWRATYPTGFAAGASPAAAWGPSFHYRTVYLSWWAKHSSNWVGQESGVNKQLYVWEGSTPALYFNSQGVGSDPLVPQVATQDLKSGTPERDLNPNLVPSARIVRGQWFHIELILVGNNAGTADGSIDWYLDGVHIGHVGGLLFTTYTTYWGLMNLAPVWGGIGPPSVPATQTFDMDHFYMSGKN